MTLEISLEGVRFRAFHGVFDFEKVRGNDFIVDLSIRVPWKEENLTDDLSTTISYADLYEVVKEEMNTPRDLIETVATQIRNRICERWPEVIEGFVKITKEKPPIPDFQGKASVRLSFF